MKSIFTLFINFQNVYSHCLVYSALNSSRHHFKASLLDAVPANKYIPHTVFFLVGVFYCVKGEDSLYFHIQLLCRGRAGVDCRSSRKSATKTASFLLQISPVLCRYMYLISLPRRPWMVEKYSQPQN